MTRVSHSSCTYVDNTRHRRCADWWVYNCSGSVGRFWQRDSPAGRVVRRAGSSSRRSGAWRRAATGPGGAPASRASNSSAASIAPERSRHWYLVNTGGALRSRPWAHYFGRALSERAAAGVRFERRFASVERDLLATSYRDGRTGLIRARAISRLARAKGPSRPSRKMRRRPPTQAGRGKLQHSAARHAACAARRLPRLASHSLTKTTTHNIIIFYLTFNYHSINNIWQTLLYFPTDRYTGYSLIPRSTIPRPHALPDSVGQMPVRCTN